MLRFPGLRPLRYRDYALYWSGLTVSQVGDWIETTTTAWLLYEITRSPFLLGLGGGIRAIATISFGLIGGAVADRVPRRRLILITQTGFALSSLALGLLVVTGRIEFWHIYVFGAVNGTLGAFDAPARRSLFPTLVPRSELQNAVTLSGAVFRVGRLIGPAIAGILIATSGPAVAYFLNFASYAAIIVGIALIRAREEMLPAAGSLVRQMAEGVRYTMRRPLLRSVLVLEAVHNVFGINTALITIFASDVFHAGPEGLGLLLSALAVGALLATGVLVTLGDIERKGEAMLAAGIAYAFCVGALVVAGRYEIAVVVIAAAGFSDALWATLRNTVFQYTADPAYRGRTLSVLLLAARGAGQASQFETGIAVALAGPQGAVGAGAALIALALAFVNARTDEIRAFRGAPEPLAAAATAPETAAE